MTRLYPTQNVPNLSIEGESGPWNLVDKNPENFILLVFFRGLHCPVCGEYLKAFDEKLDDFQDRGVEVVAISMETSERTREAKEKWKIENLEFCHALKKEQAQAWGLYLSKSIKEDEPELFCEPGLFLIKSDNTLYWSSVQTTPFARPPVEQLLSAIDYVLKEDYPARGAFQDKK